MADSPRDRAQRKAELLVQSALLREKLTVEVLSMVQMPDVLSKGLDVWRKVSLAGKKPAVIGAALLALYLIKPRRIVKLASSASSVFRMVSRFSPVIKWIFQRRGA